MRKKGFTLVEICIVIAIMGILAGLAIGNFRGLQSKYNLESQVRETYSDLMSTRLMAMNKNRTHFMVLAAGSYTIYDDTNPAPGGDGTLTIGTDTQVQAAKVLSNQMTWSGGSQVEFDSRGLCRSQKTICVYSTLNPAYDCVKLSWTRIIMGKLTTQGVCSDANCAAK
jgi:prepilin-type N-terminal cleavage/methylation domain-containing protein